MSTLDLDPDFLESARDERYAADLAADDLSQVLADEDQDARLMEQADRRMSAFAELGMEGVIR